jgi:HPt (histidine-containing phosphotransfer) domain-containing protein
VDAGMNGHLTKPIERRELAQTLSIWLRDANPAPSGALEADSADKRSPIVDHAVLEDLATQIGSENLTRVIGKFLDELDKRWHALESAQTDDDLSREAHTLSSTCRSFGLPSLADKLACIERHAKLGDDAGEPPCLAEMGRQLTEGAVALKTAVASYDGAS